MRALIATCDFSKYWASYRRWVDFSVGNSRALDVAFARRGWLPALLIILGAVAICYILIGKQIWLADWGIVDDHEIFSFLGNKQHLPFSEVVSTVLDKTEVGSLEGRFRPSYYFLRVLEASAWGRNVHLWYGIHALAFAFFLGSVWWVISRFLGLLPSALCMVPIASVNFWGAIWGRLGPAEIYAVPATGLMVLGSYGVFFAQSALRRNLGCAALTIGTLIAMGTKETLLPLACLTLFIVALAIVDRRLTLLSGLISAAITLLFFSIVAWVVFKQLEHSGADIYGTTVSPVARIKMTMAATGRFSRGFIALAMLSIVFLAGLLLRFRKLFTIGESVGMLGSLCFLVGFFISQEISYNGSLPSGIRYDFPAVLIPICFAVLIGCGFCLGVRRAGNERLADFLALGFAVGLGVCFWPISGARGIANSIDQVETNITKTREFSGELGAIIARAKMNAAAPIILEAYGSGAYEPVFSLQRYLLSAGLENPVAVRLHPDEISSGPLYDHLEKALGAIQDNGGTSFAKLVNLPSQGPCLSIGINGEADKHCWGFRVRT
jgi:hypothetical protein